ncbi:soluble inorganic pyrophosphatase 6, chloroplastic-like [Punica granatum]|uniref:inorganic diphosphatase n=1 Tax=Punica granatum TaxID=22663 RepID=A0A6P8DBZ4_PUNGR|nr:soluble inorganic pyrophosphatase 6, chloroplastic-like [Punica granatum]
MPTVPIFLNVVCVSSIDFVLIHAATMPTSTHTYCGFKIILRVKPLAALALIDEGELDGKIVVISLDDPRASVVNDVDDFEMYFSLFTVVYFVIYGLTIDIFVVCTYKTHSGTGSVTKIPDGKPANKFGLGNKPANKDYSLKVIKETNESWAKPIKRSIPSGELSLG